MKFQISKFQFDLLGQPLPQFDREKDEIIFTLAPGACHCLAPAQKPAGLSGDDYRRARAQAALALEALNKTIPAETIDGLDWHWLAEQVERSPKNFLAAASEFAARDCQNLARRIACAKSKREKIFPRVVAWTLIDRRRVTPRAAGHWLLIEDTAPFRATLEMQNAECGMQNGNAHAIHVQSIAVRQSVHVACFRAARNCGGCRIDFGTLRRHLAKNFRRNPFSGARTALPTSSLPTFQPSTLWFC